MAESTLKCSQRALHYTILLFLGKHNKFCSTAHTAHCVIERVLCVHTHIYWKKAKNDQHTYYVYKEVTSADRALCEVTTAAPRTKCGSKMCTTGEPAAASESPLAAPYAEEAKFILYIFVERYTPRRGVFFLFVFFGTHKSLDVQKKHNA